ncbi:MAG: sigma-70 family RNA polymerase sigma factor [Bacilli bacterium]
MNESLNELMNKAIKNGYVYEEQLLQFFEKDSVEYEQMIKKLHDEEIDILAQEDVQEEDVPENIKEVDEEIEKLPKAADSLTAYINDIKGFPLLTAEEEFALADEIKAGQEAKEKLETEGDALSNEEKEDLLDLIDRAEASKEYFINCNLRLVVWWSSKYRNKGLSQDDLIQEGNMGLMRAVDKYDSAKGARFSTYASNWIRKSIIRGIQNQARTIRIPVHISSYISKMKRIERTLESEFGRAPTVEEIAEEMGEKVDRVKEIQGYVNDKISLDTPVGEEDASNLGDLICDTNTSNAFEEIVKVEYKAEIHRILRELNPKEYQVITQRFGIHDGNTRTLEEIGQGLGLTRERVRQIEAKALRKLRHPSRSEKMKQYMEV